MTVLSKLLPLNLSPEELTDSELVKLHQYSLYHALHELFAYVDTDCSGIITWEELSAFLMEYASVEYLDKHIRVADSSIFELKEGTNHAPQFLRCIQSQIENSFAESRTHVDRSLHGTPIQQLLLCTERDVLLSLET
jgi:hypothetical protein